MGRKQAATLVFKELYPAVVASFENISKWLGDASGKAAMYFRCMDPSFLLSVKVRQTVLEVTKLLSIKLQDVSQDILRATNQCETALTCCRTFVEVTCLTDCLSRKRRSMADQSKCRE